MKRDDTALRNHLKAIRADIDKVLAEVAAKHGITIGTGKATYDPTALNFTFKVEGQFPGGMTKEANLYEQIRRYTEGLPEVGAVLKHPKGYTLTIAGCNTTGSKVLATHADGKTYLYPVEAIVKLNGLQRANVAKELGAPLSNPAEMNEAR